MDEINIKELLDFFKKKISLLVLITAGVFCLGGAYVLFFQTPDYKSSTTVILSSSVGESTISQTDVSLNNSLIETYTEIVKSRRVVSQAQKQLDLDLTYDEIVDKITVSDVDDAQIIKITATDGVPENAANIANAVATFFIKEVSSLYKLDNVNVLDEAVVADSPYNISYVKQLAIVFLIGAVLACAIVFVLFYFDDTVKNMDQVESKLQLEVLGKIHDNASIMAGRELVILDDPKALASEDVRTVRTNLQLQLGSLKRKTILVTSSIPGEGKSFISSNLAVAMAQTDKKVLLIDCDLRRGRTHEVFHLSNTQGLSNILRDEESVGIAGIPRFIRRTNVPNLSVITRGATPANPSELLASPFFKKVVSTASEKFDYVILDGTPIQGLPDSLIISSVVARTLVVCANEYTNLDLLDNTKKTLQRVGADLAGIVMNRMKVASDSYYGKYGKYYGNYYGSGKSDSAPAAPVAAPSAAKSSSSSSRSTTSSRSTSRTSSRSTSHSSSSTSNASSAKTAASKSSSAKDATPEA